MRMVVLLLLLLMPIATYAQGQSAGRPKKSVTVKVKVELAEQIIRDNESIRQAMSRVPGANAAILAKHLDVRLINLNFDGNQNTSSMEIRLVRLETMTNRTNGGVVVICTRMFRILDLS